jgi:hypothetical protein
MLNGKELSAVHHRPMAHSRTRFVRALTRFTAVWLAVLVISPVTAPFRICDLTDLLTSRPKHPLPVAPWSAPATAHDDGIMPWVRSLAPAGRHLKIVVLLESVHFSHDVVIVPCLTGPSIARVRQRASDSTTVLRV